MDRGKLRNRFGRQSQNFSTLYHDIFQSTDEDDEGFFWYNAKLSSRAFFMPKVNCLYIHRHRGTEKMGRANLDTGEIFFQESPDGMKDPSCIVVAPNGFQVASASTYCKVVEENNILHQVYMGVVSRYEAGMQGALIIGQLWMRVNAKQFITCQKPSCFVHGIGRTSVDHSFPLDEKIGKTGVQREIESQEIKSVVTSTGIHNEFAVFPDKRIICYTAEGLHTKIILTLLFTRILRRACVRRATFYLTCLNTTLKWRPLLAGTGGQIQMHHERFFSNLFATSSAQSTMTWPCFPLLSTDYLVDVTKETRVVRFAGPEERMTLRIRSLHIAEDGRLVIHSGNFLSLVDAGVM